MKEKTAVEVLLEALAEKTPIMEYQYWIKIKEIIHDAVIQEKFQIIQAYSNGWHDGQDVIINQVQRQDKGGDQAGEDYYEEAYIPQEELDQWRNQK